MNATAASPANACRGMAAGDCDCWRDRRAHRLPLRLRRGQGCCGEARLGSARRLFVQGRAASVPQSDEREAQGDMSDMDNWQAEQFRDECERMRQTVEALEAAARAGTPKEYIDILAYESGVAEIYNKERK
jgi:hypothetical protein